MNVKEVLDGILEQFRSGDIPEAVACAMYPAPKTPSRNWSFMNRMLILFGGTSDARGYRQWKEVSRFVNRGAKAIYILVPCFIKDVDKETGEEVLALKAFKSVAVFRYEDTHGKPLKEFQAEVPKLPLLDRAKEWGIRVYAVPGNRDFEGFYAPQKNEIGIASPAERVFFHELAHASHEKVIGKLKIRQDPLQEIVAELSALALCRLVGKRLSDTTGNSYRYIERYASGLEMSPYKACLKVLTDTEKVLNLILAGEIVSGIECEDPKEVEYKHMLERGNLEPRARTGPGGMNNGTCKDTNGSQRRGLYETDDQGSRWLHTKQCIHR